MQTMTMKQGMPTAKPMISASSFSVEQNDGEHDLTGPVKTGQTHGRTFRVS